MNNKKMMQALCLAVAVVWLAVGMADAQEIGGQIRGTVTDKTGAVIPGAKVSVISEVTGTEYKTETSETGIYAVLNLPVGTYRVKITAGGFQTSERTGIVLHASDRLTVDASLEVGAVESTITVATETTVMVQETSVVQGLVNEKQMLELPLNNRNFVQLVTLVPGVVDSLPDEVGIGLTSLVSISINGTRRNAVNWLVDGASNVDVGSNITLLSTPTVDTIAEFKILTSTYSAEWGRSGGGIVNIVTRGGGKNFHGSAYEFFRNDVMNANSFFNNAAGLNPGGSPNIPKPRLRYNNFGYTFSGPVILPGYNQDRKKTFFFWSQEWRKISRAVTSVGAIVPTAAFRNGDFSALPPAPITSCAQAFVVCDPLTGLPFPNNMIPANRFDPNAVAFLKAELWPLPNFGTNQFSSTRPDINDTRQEVIRIDHNFTDKWRLSGRYTHDLSQTVERGGLFVGTAIPDRATTKTGVPGQVLVVTLTTTIDPRTTNEFAVHASGNLITTNLIGKGRRSDYPGLNIPELFPDNPGALIPNISVTNLSSITVRPEFRILYWSGVIRDNFARVIGNHLFKAGFEISKERKSENSSGRPHGDFAFNGSRTSGGRTTNLVPFADFLLGLANTYTEAEREIINHLRFGRREFYVQDSWKVHPRFTLDLGVRYSYYEPIKDRDNVLTTFSPEFFDPAQAPAFANVSGTQLVPGSGNFLNGIIIAGVNSPFGEAIYASDLNNWSPRFGFAWNTFGNNKMVVRGGYGIYYDQPLVGIFEQNAFVNPPFNREVTFTTVSFAAPSGGAAGALGVAGLISSATDFVNPITQQWNLGIQYQLFRRALLEIGYAGSGGNHLIRPTDLNFPQPDAANALPSGRQNLVRPFLAWGGITHRDTTATNRYHAMLVNFRTEGVKGLTLNIAYTWSKNLTDATNDRDAVDIPQNPLNLRAERGVARSDRTHVFNASYIWEIPWMKTHESFFVRHVLGGWQFSGITSIQSGLPLSRILASTTSNFRRGNRANQVSNPFENIPAGLFLFNPAAFVDPPLGTYGNTGRGFIRGPGRHQWDLSLSKNWFYHGETGRVQFRADMFNAFNHTQFSDQSQTVGSSTFGRYISTRRPREIQFGLKVYF